MCKYYLNYLARIGIRGNLHIAQSAGRISKPHHSFLRRKRLHSHFIMDLAKKGLYPCKIPFALAYVDTGHNFPETIQFQDNLVDSLDAPYIVGSIQEFIDEEKVCKEKDENTTRNALRNNTLSDNIEANKIDCAIGGSRNDEEKARAKALFYTGMILVKGTRKISGRNFGTYSMKSTRSTTGGKY